MPDDAPAPGPEGPRRDHGELEVTSDGAPAAGERHAVRRSAERIGLSGHGHQVCGSDGLRSRSAASAVCRECPDQPRRLSSGMRHSTARRRCSSPPPRLALGRPRRRKARRDPKNSCTTCKERRRDPRPEALRGHGSDPEVVPGYEIARKYPATLDRLHCFCECAESPTFQHKTLLTCFTTPTPPAAASASPRRSWPRSSRRRALSDEEIEITVESVHKTDGHPPTTTEPR